MPNTLFFRGLKVKPTKHVDGRETYIGKTHMSNNFVAAHSIIILTICVCHLLLFVKHTTRVSLYKLVLYVLGAAQ